MQSMNKIFTAYEQKNDYNSNAYSHFFEAIENGTADWNEFLPAPLKSVDEAIILRVKCKGEADFKTLRQPNTRLYMLKNEMDLGAFYGFTCTDLFNVLKAVAHEKHNWFGRAVAFTTYTNEVNGSRIKMVELVAMDMAALKEILLEISKLSDQLAKTNSLMQRWTDALANKNTKNQVFSRMGSYLTHVARMEGVSLYNKHGIKGEGKTRYHYFHLVTSSQSFEELLNKTIVFNLDMDGLMYGFEEFYMTYEHGDVNFKKSNLSELVARNVFIA